MNTIYILEKTTRKGDHGRIWIFSTAEKREEFKAKFELEDDTESMYEEYSKDIDPTHEY